MPVCQSCGKVVSDAPTEKTVMERNIMSFSDPFPVNVVWARMQEFKCGTCGSVLSLVRERRIFHEKTRMKYSEVST